jgi:Na+-driven multidrug efflux pump
MVVGQMNNEVALAGAGVGNTFIDIFGMAIWMGLDGAMCTLVSQAVGASEYKNCGIYRQRTRFIFTAGIVCCIPIYIFAS